MRPNMTRRITPTATVMGFFMEASTSFTLYSVLSTCYLRNWREVSGMSILTNPIPSKPLPLVFRVQPLLYFEYRISNKEFRTAEVFKSSKAMFFTSIFCGSLFCGSAVHILKGVIADSSMLSADQGERIRSPSCTLKGMPKAVSYAPGFFTQ
jgi:hypothetical protein